MNTEAGYSYIPPFLFCLAINDHLKSSGNIISNASKSIVSSSDNSTHFMPFCPFTQQENISAAVREKDFIHGTSILSLIYTMLGRRYLFTDKTLVEYLMQFFVPSWTIKRVLPIYFFRSET